MRAKRPIKITFEPGAFCANCGGIAHSQKVKPVRPWRRLGFTKFRCDECGNRWRVYLGRATARRAPRADRTDAL